MENFFGWFKVINNIYNCIGISNGVTHFPGKKCEFWAMQILGIETSCDETAVAVVQRNFDGTGEILSNMVWSQTKDHAPYGGVVPEIAARAHIATIDHVLNRTMKEAEIDPQDLDAIAVTAGPGLKSGLLVGLMTAKGLAFATSKPLIAVNHLEGHALTARLTDNLSFPYLLLLVSGGHTQFVCVEELGRYRRWGSTIDDALGEAFDKIAKLLGLSYPGGPAVEAAAILGQGNRFAFPRPMLDRKGLDMSFAGLKTAVRIQTERIAPISDQDIADICASFQNSVTDILENRTMQALGRFSKEFPNVPPVLVVAGGVAANKHIRAALERTANHLNARLVAPPGHLCTDNGAMIAWVGAEKHSQGQSDPLSVSPRSRWPLDETTEPLVGHGRRGAKV